MRPVAALLGLVMLLACGPAFGADFAEVPFAPLMPEIMGQGGGMVANSHGWGSFFANPAGLSRERGATTLLESGAWMYSRPDRIGQFAFDSIMGRGSDDVFGLVNTELTSGGLGAGASIGLGYAGNGLGLGLAIVADSYFWGPTAMGASGDMTVTVGFMGGVAYPVIVAGVPIHIGGLVRPMIRVHAPLENTDALAMFAALASQSDVFAAISSASAVYGVGVGLDLGAIAELGWVTLGLAVRDLGGTTFNYSSNALANIASAFGAQMGFPPGAAVADRYTIPMDVSVGLSLHPDLGAVAAIIDPTLHLDIDDAVSVVRSIASGEETFWTRVRAGAELRLLSIASLWGGLDGGYLTFGAGLHLVFLDASMAVFTREMGRYIGDRPSAGATLELAIRF